VLSVSRITARRVIGGLKDAAAVVTAAGDFLDQLGRALRHLVHAVGWIVILVSTVRLIGHPALHPGQLIAPGAGVLAVVQDLIGPWHARGTHSKQPHPAQAIALGESAAPEMLELGDQPP
jgi:hypothetical protein